MKTTLHFFSFFVGLIVFFACSKDLDDFLLDENGHPVDNEHVKSISCNGITIRKFRYDSSGKLIEVGSTFSYSRYTYDGKGLLVKAESAFDESLLSSYYDPNHPPRAEIMTAANSTITSTGSYKYDNQGRLAKIEFYASKGGDHFIFTSLRTFEYEGDNIRRENLCDEKGNITQYYEYTYDKKGNRSKETYNVCIFDGTPSNPKLYYERTYKYDSFKNPFRILNLASPGFYTSANNMIEMKTVWYTDDPRTETTKQSFEYNNNGYPSMMMYDGGVEVYNY
ncbi:MAG: hypothetical protein LBE79_01645 [Tannerella sp.]|jgi:hypothetical protein|nr:hypothetical protein [Tannerella sp.]